jgi:hypothetical protein
MHHFVNSTYYITILKAINTGHVILSQAIKLRAYSLSQK